MHAVQILFMSFAYPLSMKSITLIASVLVSVALLASSCTAPNRASRVLVENGYSDIQLTGFAWFGCGENDLFSDGFIAKSSNGSTVRGVVCSGFPKGSTIRFF